jgi:hypothetical protein
MGDIIKLIFEKVFYYDTNISEFEKMINRYKITRKKTLLLYTILFIYVVVITGFSYLIQRFVPNLTILAFGVLFLFFPAIKLFKSHPLKLGLILFYIYIPIALTTFIINMYFHKLSFENFTLSVVSIVSLTIVYSSYYLYILDKLTLKVNTQLTIVLSDNEEITARLITVTNSGDYIIKPLNNVEEEVLIMKDQVKKVIYKNNIS